MQLQWIIFCCFVGWTIAREAGHILPKQGNFFEWLIGIFLPPPPPPPPVTTTTSRTTTSRTTIPTTSSSTFTSSVANFPIERECGTCRCGLINTLHKIVGGQETRIHQYPWMAVVLIHERFYCAGSLINDLYVLTAAHCVEGVPVELLSLRLLEHNRSHPNVDLLVQRSVSQVRVHELYNSRTFDHDIALLRLNEPVDVVGLHLRPICLPLKGHSFDHELAIVTGWGAQTEAGFASETLQEVDVLVIPQSDCRNATAYKPGQITDNMLCAGQLDEGGKDACGGESGGPLQVTFAQMPGQYQLAGIVSWGVGCARPNTPGVYTRVGQYLRWLSANTPGACHCTPYTEEYY